MPSQTAQELENEALQKYTARIHFSGVFTPTSVSHQGETMLLLMVMVAKRGGVVYWLA